MPDFKLSGNSALAYLGVRAGTPAQMVFQKRAPTTQDLNYAEGTQWVYQLASDVTKSVQYVLVSKAINQFSLAPQAIWVPLNQSGDQPTLPNHSVVLGTGSPGFNSVSPIATLGAPLVSQGTSSDPVFGVASVSGGGTGLTAPTPYNVLCGGDTSEDPLNQVAGTGSSGQVLTSNGASTLPTWQNATGSSTGGPIAIQMFTSGSGNYTPTAGMGSCIVEIIGGGAGGMTAQSGIYGAPGGGAGGYSSKLYLATTIGASQPYSVGAGGATDANGSDTTFGTGGTLITAHGGSAAASVTAPGVGGVGVGGTTNLHGGAGGIGSQTDNLLNGNFSGFGGSSYYGKGAAAKGNSSGFGNGGIDFGSGGGGGLDTSGLGTQHGGAGSGGLVIITEFGPYGILPPVGNTTINIIVLDTPGAGTYTPNTNLLQATVECIGGGAGGQGTGTSGSMANIGRSGGSGGYVKKLFSKSALGAMQPYFVGSGGAGGAAGINDGANGTDTTFSSGGSLLTAGGGQQRGTNFLTGGGGTATGGDINIPGQAGYPGNSPSQTTAWTIGVGGPGGNSMYGSGGSAAIGSGASSTPYQSGFNGTGYGSGGSGGAVAQGSVPNVAGGNGADGVIIITEYISA